MVHMANIYIIDGTIGITKDIRQINRKAKKDNAVIGSIY